MNITYRVKNFSPCGPLIFCLDFQNLTGLFQYGSSALTFLNMGKSMIIVFFVENSRLYLSFETEGI